MVVLAMFYVAFTSLHADTNIRIRGVGAINEIGEYEDAGKKAEKLQSGLFGTSIFIGKYGFGQSKLTTSIEIENTKQELMSNWLEIALLFDFTKTTSLSIGIGSTTSGEGKLEAYDTEYKTENVSGKSWFLMMGFEYKPIWLAKTDLIKFLELLFGVRENLVEYQNFKKNGKTLSSKSKINSIQLFWGLGIVF